MDFRVSGSAWVRIRRTTLAGISSTRSTASSRYSSSTTSLSSLSEKALNQQLLGLRVHFHKGFRRLLLR